MKKHPFRFILFFLMCVSIPFTATAQIVTIPDDNLRAEIEVELEKAPGATITTADMAKLTELQAPNANISDLTGLEHATNLTELDLGAEYVEEEGRWINSNSVSNLSPLAGLTKLTWLNLWGNNISDLSPLSRLTRLTDLRLESNAITDISPLAGLVNLVELQLGSNTITDISSLSGMVNLTWLGLWANNISDISAVSGLTTLMALSLSGNSVSDISPVAGLTNLRSLNLGGNSLSNISPLSGLTNLTRLWLWSNTITDISPLAGLTNLGWLDLGSNNISDISPLVANTGLGDGDEVYVEGNPLSYTSINTHIPALQGRGVTVEFDNVITELVAIPDMALRDAIAAALDKAPGAPITTADMAKLTELIAQNADITDLTGLEHATNLTQLDLGTEYVQAEDRSINSNSVSDLSPLADLTSLTDLWLESNAITDISPLADLVNLTVLVFWDNNVTDISDLAKLTNLMELWLDDNNISDISPLVANTGLGNGDRVFVVNNPLNRASIETHIPALQERGVTVEFDNVITELVAIPDDNLRAKIEERLGKAPGAPITTADMAKLTELIAQNADITDLTGLEHATNLTRLDLGTEYVPEEGRSINSNSVSDLSPLAGLTNLTWLRLRNNSISDISALAGLTNLTWLNLGGNLMISDISPLSGLTNLETLWLYATSISDISALAGLTNLTSLYLWFNSISDLSPLAGLTNLTWLGLYNNLVSDISDLAGLTNLTYLTLSNHSTFIPATGLTHLTSININNNSISDLSPLVENTGLGSGDTVEVWGNPLSDASISTHLPGLQSRGVRVEFIQIPTFLLKISGTVTALDNLLIVEVRDNRDHLFAGVPVTFTVISGGGTLSVTNIITNTNGRAESRLTLGPNAGTNTVHASVEGISQPVIFSDVPEPPVDIPDANLRARIESELDKPSGAPITASDMARLRHLDARNANISDLTRLEAAINLTSLDLGGNNISAISAVADLTNLTSLDLGGNNISDISPIAGLNNLTSLGLNDNNISAISAVADLTNLTWLLLDNNNISDISAVAGLTNLTSLDLWNNNISDISPLSGLTNLGDLFLDNNSISDISPLAKLPRLALLGLNDNSITDISPLAGLTRLRWCLLGNNSITDISPLATNTGLGEEDLVTVTGNPLSYLSIHTHIPILQSRGVTVEFDRPVETLSGHTDGVVSVAFSPDGRILASGSNDNTVRLWDTVTELPIATLIGHTATARSVAFSPDGSILASGSHDNTVILWDVATGQPKDTLTEHDTPVETVAFSRDGSILASGSHDGTIILWDVATGQPNTIIQRANRIWSLAFSPDGTLAIGQDDGSVLLWDVANGQPKDILRGHTGFVEGVAFSPDGSTLASGSYDHTVRLWDVVTGQPIYTLRGHTGGINSVAFSPDGGTILASGSDDNTVRLWDPLTGDPIDTLTGHTSFVRSVAFNRDGSVLASGSGDSTVRLWELAPSTVEYRLSIPADISLIHVPLKVATVDGVEKTIGSVGDLYDALGGADTVTSLVTLDSQAQKWHSYVGTSSTGTPADKELTDDMGIIAIMKTPVSVYLTGAALGTNGTSSITLNPGHNLVGLPLRDERIDRVSDLLRLDGIWGNVSVITLNDGGKFKTVRQAGDPGDIEITGGQAFILLGAQQTATVEISGEAWTNVSEIAAAPPVAFQGIKVGTATPVLGLSGSVVGEAAGLKGEGFRVTVKNLSTGRAVTDLTKDDDRVGYQLTVVDIETMRAATVGDILEISAQSPHPFIGVEPLRYTVTAEDVKRSQIQLPQLVVYEIPTETELLRNYPNPFNPETWIPYRLAEDADVKLTIYDSKGRVVRSLDIGHQVAAVYESRSKAIYWDGRNAVGESVASGLYFYHLSAGDYSATRRMVILK